MGALSPTHWAVLAIVVLLLAGSKKLPDMARGLGQSMRILKAESRALREDGRPVDGRPADGAGGDEHPEARPSEARPSEARQPEARQPEDRTG